MLNDGITEIQIGEIKAVLLRPKYDMDAYTLKLKLTNVTSKRGLEFLLFKSEANTTIVESKFSEDEYVCLQEVDIPTAEIF